MRNSFCPKNVLMRMPQKSEQRTLGNYFSAMILCPVAMNFSYIQENDLFGRFYPFHNFYND